MRMHEFRSCAMPRTTPSRPFATAGGSTCAHMPAHGVTCALLFTLAATSLLKPQGCRRAEQHPSVSCSPIRKIPFKSGPITSRHRLPVLQKGSLNQKKHAHAAGCCTCPGRRSQHICLCSLTCPKQSIQGQLGMQAEVVMPCLLLTCLAKICLLYQDLAQTR